MCKRIFKFELQLRSYWQNIKFSRYCPKFPIFTNFVIFQVFLQLLRPTASSLYILWQGHVRNTLFHFCQLPPVNRRDHTSIESPLSCMSACIDKIRHWVTENYPKFNEDKTEFSVAIPNHLRQYLPPVSLRVGTKIIHPVDSVRSVLCLIHPCLWHPRLHPCATPWLFSCITSPESESFWSGHLPSCHICTCSFEIGLW